MTQHDLLKKLDEWANGGGPICNEGAEIAELMRLAAAEIRRLQTSVSTVQRHSDQKLDALVALVKGEMETGQ